METILFIGIQGSGKSSFYRQRFSSTHVHINLDSLKTRHRERTLLMECLQTKRALVVDNTNPARLDRAAYVSPSKEAGFRVVAYYFQSRVEDCQRRNAQRTGQQQVPLRGLLGTAGRLELPRYEEGFDQLHYVRIGDDGQFIVEDWIDEV